MNRLLLRFLRFLLEGCNSSFNAMALLEFALPFVRLLLAWTNLDIPGWNRKDNFPYMGPYPTWTMLGHVLMYLWYVCLSGSILRRITSHEKADAAWRSSRAISIEAERRVERRVEACDTYIREAKEAHHTWCSEMLQDVRRQQRELRFDQERFEAEKEEFRARAGGGAKKRRQSV